MRRSKLRTSELDMFYLLCLYVHLVTVLTDRSCFETRQLLSVLCTISNLQASYLDKELPTRLDVEDSGG